MDFLILALILIMSVVIHEVSHGYAALALGDPTAKYEGRLTLNPLHHLDPLGSIIVPLIGYLTGGFIIGWAKPVPFNPYNLRPEKLGLPKNFGELFVAIAGPASNLALALVFGLFLRTAPTALNETFHGLIQYIVFINITLAVFNLIPIPPLDGSQILFALIPYSWMRVRNYIERVGFWLVIIFIFFFWSAIDPFVIYLFKLFTGISA